MLEFVRSAMASVTTVAVKAVIPNFVWFGPGSRCQTMTKRAATAAAVHTA